jgi:hypothetical protein
MVCRGSAHNFAPQPQSRQSSRSISPSGGVQVVVQNETVDDVFEPDPTRSALQTPGQDVVKALEGYKSDDGEEFPSAAGNDVRVSPVGAGADTAADISAPVAAVETPSVAPAPPPRRELSVEVCFIV